MSENSHGPPWESLWLLPRGRRPSSELREFWASACPCPCPCPTFHTIFNPYSFSYYSYTYSRDGHISNTLRFSASSIASCSSYRFSSRGSYSWRAYGWQVQR